MSRSFFQVLILGAALTFRVWAQTDCPSSRQVTVTIQTNPYPSLPGRAVRISAFVQPVEGATDPAGTLQLLDGLTDMGTFPVALGQVSVNRTFYDAGAHQINALYSGDFNYCGAITSSGHAVDRITPSVALASSTPSAGYGTPVTFTAQVTPNAPEGVAGPAGPVQFFEGTALLGTSPLAGGKAALTLSNLDAGSHQVTATLVGDPNWYSVRSAPVKQTITPAGSETLLTATSTASQVTVTATVKTVPATAAVPTGSVLFIDGIAGVNLATAPLPPGSPSATVIISNSQFPTNAVHSIISEYSGSTNIFGSTSGSFEIPAIASATGAASPNFAPDEIVSLYGYNLTSGTPPVSASPPLPTDLGGANVTVTDKPGTSRKAALYLVSAKQINLVIPSATAFGAAAIALSGDIHLPVYVNMVPVAPGLFNPGAQILRVNADGSQSVESVTDTTPISIGPGPTYLILFGTGFRNRSSLGAVTVAIGAFKLPAAYAGAQQQFPGLDQVNVLLPAGLQGAGKVDVTLTADGQASNSVPLTFR